jgi:hypothetical protein
MSWVNTYQKQYYNLLMPQSSGAKRGLVEGHCQRGNGFLLMFQKLLEQRSNNFQIIETGTLRNPGNWKDGQSAQLFTEFVKHHGGKVRSVDIDPAAVKTANDFISTDVFVSYCSDSVEFLKQQPDLDQVDLFYLDSWDVKWENDTGSAEHHLKEFLAIEPHLKSGAVVAIDDNSRHLLDNRRTGKGRRVVEYLTDKNIHPVYDAYQIIYQF